MILDGLILLNTPLSWLLTLILLTLTVWAIGHALLHKRDSRAAVIWVGLILFSPVLGPLFYYVFGINRIRRKAAALKSSLRTRSTPQFLPVDALPPSLPAYFSTLITYGDAILQDSITSGNQIDLLDGSETAFPAIIAAIDSAQTSISLMTYIFGTDAIGQSILDALGRAQQRGVAIRVLIDGIGSFYTPQIWRKLKAQNIPHALFLPLRYPWDITYANLRNHRKIIVIDGEIGFTGGMNLRGYYLPFRDLHFRLKGIIVSHLQQVFVEDWHFCTKEKLAGKTWFPPLEPAGSIRARGIPDGADADFEKIHWMMLGAIATAQQSIWIQTPYFVPDSQLISALSIAALSGIEVVILIPERSNLPAVDWASVTLQPFLLKRNCRIFAVPPPFDHSKLMIVDDHWTLIGSSNWDGRSLRINFEFNVECYDADFARQCKSLLQEKRAKSREIVLENVVNLPLRTRLRNGVVRLFSPYL